MKTKNRFWKSAVRLVMYLSLFQAACVTGCLNKVARNVNPCGTILNCNPAEWDWMFHSADYPDYSADPTCVIPGQCDTTWPPTEPGQLGSGSSTTTTTTGTTTGGYTGGYGGGYTGGYGGGYTGGYGGGYSSGYGY
jgi:hypothetical protein